jgi:hypothetical protein
MRDTYWSTGDGVHIKLTDENIDEFELIFERDKVKQIRKDSMNQYEDVYCVAIDSGGVGFPKYFVDKDAVKSKELVINELDSKIDSLQREIRSLQEQRDRIEDGTYKLEWF